MLRIDMSFIEKKSLRMVNALQKIIKRSRKA